jgi:5,10-methylenetetrahydromethanopterin reductase
MAPVGLRLLVRFGLRIPPCANVREVARCVADAERAGFDIAWLPDSQFLWRDVWASLALAAEMTDRITLGTCVTNFETRHPSVTAAAAVTLEELAPERTILGVGSGDSSIKTLGLTPTRLAEMRDGIDLVRRLTAGETIDFEGRQMHLHASLDRPVPVYMAANGPKALELTGELADGVITVAGIAPDLVERMRARVAVGAERAGRSLDEIELCFGTFCHVTDDEREAARIVKPYVVAMAQVGGRETLRSIGIEIDPPAVVAGIYPDMSHAEDWDQAADAAEEWVTDEMALRYADAFCLVGSAEHCRERIARAAAAGATNLYVRHFSSYTLPDQVLAAYGELIIPSFAA